MLEKQDLVIHLGSSLLTLRIGSGVLASCSSWNTNRHCNADYELHMVLTGACTVDVAEQSCHLSSGSGILIAPGQYHFPKMEPGAFQRFSLSFSIQGDNKMLFSSSFFTFSLNQNMQRICSETLAEFSSKRPFQEEMLTALLSQLMVETVRTLQLAEAARPALPAFDGRTDVIDDFFEHHLTEYGMENALADLLHLSRRQLSRVLSDCYGMSFRQKLLCARMDHAAYLLRTTEKSVSEISALVGYVSETAFYKMFKAHFASTPQKYRRTSKQEIHKKKDG